MVATGGRRAVSVQFVFHSVLSTALSSTAPIDMIYSTITAITSRQPSVNSCAAMIFLMRLSRCRIECCRRALFVSFELNNLPLQATRSNDTSVEQCHAAKSHERGPSCRGADNADDRLISLYFRR